MSLFLHRNSTSPAPLYDCKWASHRWANRLGTWMTNDIACGNAGKDTRYPSKLRRLLAKMPDGDRKMILYMAQKKAKRQHRALPLRKAAVLSGWDSSTHLESCPR